MQRRETIQTRKLKAKRTVKLEETISAHRNELFACSVDPINGEHLGLRDSAVNKTSIKCTEVSSVNNLAKWIARIKIF